MEAQAAPAAPPGDLIVRRSLEPGDLGAIAGFHGRLYASEYGVDGTFEGGVLGGLATAGERGFPRDGEGIWIVELDGILSGVVGLTNEGDGEARLRWVLLAPELRGRGIGRTLIGEALDLARRSGYERVTLETFSELRAAAAIYRSHGFEVVWSRTGPLWGRAELTYQRYELRF
jgi:ribosomal protein S18 acetylase RimI-like enzyme